jgi:tryptophanyl-tRNA synthetase
MPHLLPLPQTLLSPAKKIMSLRQPTLKMSKSHPEPRSRILITDSAATIRSKIMSALTDSIPGPVTFDSEERPGVSNLLSIVAYLREEESTPEGVATEMAGLTMREFKERVAEEVADGMAGVRDEYERLIGREAYLNEVAAEGAKKARASATATLDEVKVAVGLA